MYYVCMYVLLYYVLFHLSLSIDCDTDFNSSTLTLCQNAAKDCLKSLSDQKSDVFISRTSFDKMNLYQNIFPFQSLSQDGYFIISPYNCSHEKAILDSVPSDMIDSVHAFSLNIWISILIILILISGILYMHLRMYNGKPLIPNTLFTVISFILRNPNMTIFSFTSKIISLTINLFTFLVVICYFMNIIKTDRVRMKEQHVYRSYRDIVHSVDDGNNMKIFYTSQSEFPSSLLFEPRTEIKKKLSKYIITEKRGSGMGGKSLISKFVGEKYNFLMMDGMLSTTMTKYFACSMMPIKDGRNTPDTCLHRTQELTDDIQSINEILASNGFKRKLIYENFTKRSIRIFESGLMSRAYSLIYGEIIPKRSTSNCLSVSKNVIQHSPEFQSLDIDMYYKCFFCLCLILITAVIILIFETIFEYLKRAKKKKRQKMNTVWILHSYSIK